MIARAWHATIAAIVVAGLAIQVVIAVRAGARSHRRVSLPDAPRVGGRPA